MPLNLPQSYDEEFCKVFKDLWKKYPEEVFKLEGLHPDILDINKSAREFFKHREDNSTISDRSIDGNSNVSGKSAITFLYEVPKPLLKMNSIYNLWRIIRDDYDLETANSILENEICGDIYINDAWDMGRPYSLVPNTNIIIKKDDKIISLSLENLFNDYKDDKKTLYDYEEIDLTKYGIQVYEENKWVDLQRVVRHITDKKVYRFETGQGNVFSVTSDHPCILSDGSEKPAEDVRLGEEILSCEKGLIKDHLDIGSTEGYSLDDFYQIGSDVAKNNKLFPRDHLNFGYSEKNKLLSGAVESIGTFDGDNSRLKTSNLGFAQQIAEIASCIGYGNVEIHSDGKNFIVSFTKRKDDVEKRDNKVISKKEEKFEGYVYDITTSSGRFYSNGCILHNCFNYSTHDIALKGLPVSGKLKIVPPKSFTSFLHQIEQFVVYAANMTLGATGLADLLIVSSWYIDRMLETGKDNHIRVARDSSKEAMEEDVWTYVKECFAHLIYTVNFEFRGNQCVTEDTEVLTPEGFKKYNEINEGDEIYTWKDGNLNINSVQKVNVYDYDGEMHQYEGRSFCEVVTPNHRVLYYTDKDKCKLSESSEIFGKKTLYIPSTIENVNKIIDINPDDVQDFFNFINKGDDEPEWLFKVSKQQAQSLISLWPIMSKEQNRIIFKVENFDYADKLQHLAVLAGYASVIDYENMTVTLHMDKDEKVVSKSKIQYTGKVWCPTTEDGVVIFRKNGKVFVSGNSPFTNISVYDKYFLMQLVPNYEINGVTPRIETVKKAQEIFMDTMNEELRRCPVTFPVTTACFSVKEVDGKRTLQDEEFLKEISEKNLEHAFMNIYSGSTSTLSSCCFSKDTKVLWKHKDKVNLTTFEDLYNKGLSEIEIYHNGNWKKAKPISLPNRPMYKVKTENGKRYLVTDNHINVTLNGEKKTEELTSDDYLLFNSQPLDGKEGLSYSQGFALGAFIACGHFEMEDDNLISSVRFSVSKAYLDELTENVNSANHSLGSTSILEIILSDENDMYFVEIKSDKLTNFIIKWTKWKLGVSHETNRDLDLDCLLESVDFRKGILDGLNVQRRDQRIYRTEIGLINKIETVAISVGGLTSHGSVKGENALLYWVTWNQEEIRKYCSVKCIEDKIFFKILSINKVDYEDNVYCIERLDEKDPYFTLPSGLITHNCRLRSSISDLGYTNTFGSGSSKIGSIGVVSINLPRIAKMSLDNNENFDKFLDRVKKITRVTGIINNSKRKFLKDRAERGALPLYTLGFMEFDKQYSTTGFTGLYEAMSILGYDMLSDEGVVNAGKTLDAISEEYELMAKEFNAPHNTEQVPAESSSIKLAKKDKLLGIFDDKPEWYVPFYSNQFLPLIKEGVDLIDRIDVQGKLDQKCTGGAVCHLNIDNQIQNVDTMINLIKYACEKGVIYFAVNYQLNECENSHFSVGRYVDKCPTCGKDIVNQYTRVVGFLTNVKYWQFERREHDFPNRKFYNRASKELDKAVNQ